MKKTLLATMIVSTFGLTACGGGDSSSGGSSSSGSSSTTTALSISGVVNKGIVRDGAVTVCLATAANTANKSCASALATGTTDSTGAFDLTGINLELDKPVLLVVKDNPDGDTQMKCDLAASCTGPDGTTTYTFGEWMPVSESYKRIAIITPSRTTTSANITNLTHLAAEKAITDAGSADVTAATVKAAQLTVANKLGITSSIQDLGSVDITDPSAVASSDADEVTAALYSASLDSFYDADGTDTSGEAATLIDDTADSTVVDSLIATVETNASTITASVNAAITQAVTDGELTTDEQNAASSNITAADNTVTAADPASVTSTTEEEAEAALTQDRAVALVEQIRTVVTAADDGTIEGSFDSLYNEVSPVTDLMSANMDGIGNKLLEAVNAVAIAYANNNSLDSSDITSSYTATNSGTTYTVSTTDGSVSLVATITSAIVIEGDETNDTECSTADAADGYTDCNSYSGEPYANISISFDSLSITEGSTTLSLTGDEASQVIISNFNGSWSDSRKVGYTSSTNSTTYTSSDESSADQITLALNGATLAYSDNTTFTGTISLTATNPYYTYSESKTYTNSYSTSGDTNSESGTYSDEVTMTGLSVQIAGEIASSTSNTVGVNLTATLSNASGYRSKYSEVWNSASGVWSYNDSLTDSLGSETEETESSFIAATISAGIESDITNTNNVTVATSVNVTATRTSLDTAAITATVGYNGVSTIFKTTDANSASNDTTVTITSSEDNTTIATLNISATGAYSGNIKVDDEVEATISESSGMAMITYTDGSFESFY